MKARKGECYFVSLQPAVKRVFEIVRAVEIESVFASTQELDDYLAKIQRDIAQTDEKSAN
jgi:sigma-B regulation protein RsbU (phosphoserine phosphatase)